MPSEAALLLAVAALLLVAGTLLLPDTTSLTVTNLFPTKILLPLAKTSFWECWIFWLNAYSPEILSFSVDISRCEFSLGVVFW
ncbi:MAG: hypothetical protein MPL62_14990 [Alphaproteobacteria bacterium]|nr:hypothetical protein [Alphaproteobacteria bacterium]